MGNIQTLLGWGETDLNFIEEPLISLEGFIKPH